jgi:hypothetical protein
MTATPTTLPQDGLDRCPCGCKYWTVDAAGLASCHDCGDLFRPEPAKPEADEPRPDWVADLAYEEEYVPTCSLCDGAGHGYPGAGPCPLEERGSYDAEPWWAN